MKKSTLIIGLGLVALAGAGIYFYMRKKNNSGGAIAIPTDDTPISDSGAPSTSGADLSELEWVKNSKVAEVLASRLNTQQQKDLKGWVMLIDNERKQDPAKWGTTNNLPKQSSDIAHALYQMEVWNTDFLNDILAAQ